MDPQQDRNAEDGLPERTALSRSHHAVLPDACMALIHPGHRGGGVALEVLSGVRPALT